VRVIKVFIDSSGWYALVQREHEHHEAAKEYFQQILDSRTRLYTNITEISSAIFKIKQNCGLSVATDFSKLIDQSVLSTSLNVSWMTRRLHRSALKHFFTIKDVQIEIRHCLIFEEVKKKKINFIFSFDDTLKSFGIPLMPQA
jgi:predicted nucleic acid-binding protein